MNITEGSAAPDATVASVARHDPYAALRFRDFRLLLAGTFLAVVVEQMLGVAIGWELYERTGSAFALETLEVTEGPERWLESLAALRPELALDPENAILSTWDDDPFVRAAYSISPGPETTAALIEPVGPFRFVGEHTAGPFSALMEGAVRSGLRPDVSQA